MRNLSYRLIQVDEVWGFIGMKRKTAMRQRATGEVGDVWTWVAIDPETKLVPTFAVGDGSGYMANCFIEDLASRLSHRVQLSCDAFPAYIDAVERAFGAQVDYGSIIKTFSHSDLEEQRRYSPPDVMSVKRVPVGGTPVVDLISTSHVETELHSADALPPSHAVDQCVLQEVRQLQSCRRAALRLLQFRENQYRDSMHASDGGRRRKFRVDGSRFGGEN
jgi:hypothetical protein